MWLAFLSGVIISIGNIFLYQRSALTFRCQHLDCLAFSNFGSSLAY